MSIRFGYNVLVFISVLSLDSFAALYEGDKCSLQDGSEGKCKLLKECPTAMQLIQTGVNPIICRFEKLEAIVCCKDGEEVMNTTSTTTITDRISSNRKPGKISKQKCEEYAEYAYEKIYSPTLLLKPQFTKKFVCVIQRFKLDVGNTLVSRAEFPHMALIGYQQNDSVVWKCGGSLISENFVLTAAHCMFPQALGRPKYVKVGFRNESEFTDMQELTVSEVIPHPKYNNTLYHDIGLLRLSKNVQFNAYLRPACLNRYRFSPFGLSVASGWGTVSFEREPSKDLLATVLEPFSREDCNQIYTEHISSTLKDGIVDDLMICAGTTKAVRTTCQLDFGGFLQVYHEEFDDGIKCMYDVVGIPAFTDRCSSKIILEVHTRVSNYIKWIEDIVWPDEFPGHIMSIRFDYSVLLFVLILSRGFSADLYKGDKCLLKDGSDGICKLIKECPTAVQLIEKGVNPAICGFEAAEPIVCCEDDVTETTSTTRTPNPVTSRTPGDISKKKCKEFAEYAYEKIYSPTLLLKPQFTKNLVCEIHRSKLLAGSTTASRREFPHMALIGYKPVDEVIWDCGGSLISENFVLTAAQCLVTRSDGPAKLVRIGFTNKTDPTHMQERTVSEIIAYPKRNNTKYHDIGLLKLSKNVKFNTYARPACLHTEKYIPYDYAIMSGWGAVGFGEEQSNELLETEVEFFGADKCSSTYSRDISSASGLKDGIVDDLMICAGRTKAVKTICWGDFGGPLQVYHKETEEVKCMYDIVGVISFTKGCGFKDIPGVYTRVSAYVEWIEDTVWAN
ncbi:uncharacterized protein LOC108904130 [Anoplophora glabripennis]|uniref:uncharacterized protein LOC108904130 n=1 Tax=Anoplophora glabripennis TaxID=217634 RepID=UPI0008741E1B|nr:uncharacterized protein LOC108904130 [Anoplophora glabripennis]